MFSNSTIASLFSPSEWLGMPASYSAHGDQVGQLTGVPELGAEGLFAKLGNLRLSSVHGISLSVAGISSAVVSFTGSFSNGQLGNLASARADLCLGVVDHVESLGQPVWIEQLFCELGVVGGCQVLLWVHGEPSRGHDTPHPGHDVHLDSVHAGLTADCTCGRDGGVHHGGLGVLSAEPADPGHRGGCDAAPDGCHQGVPSIHVALAMLPCHPSVVVCITSERVDVAVIQSLIQAAVEEVVFLLQEAEISINLGLEAGQGPGLGSIAGVLINFISGQAQFWLISWLSFGIKFVWEIWSEIK